MLPGVSFVFGQIMYRPLKDVDGIPGAKCLIVCLTGYQRQDRDDIMVCIYLLLFPLFPSLINGDLSESVECVY